MESEKVQVIICGGGSAGLTAAIWLARFNIDFKILERRPGPLEIGQADGVQCRTVEIFENLGISERLLEEAYHVMEGCDGAHSTVRKSLGFKMVGDSSDSVWGVMDVYPVTNFPDIRKKAMLQSKSDGNLMIIPREGDELVRFYIELSGTSARDVTEQDLINKVKRIFHPYDIDIARTVWWSAYVIGQRLADHFTKDHRIFLTGDACHTHSPKAGQGMNVSLQDGFNIGWKMAHVLTGRAPPSVLETYVLERQQTAQQLIEFDRSFSKLFSSEYRKANGITAKHFRDKFVEAGRYTAGMATRYKPSIVTSLEESDNSIASGLTVGMRFPSAPVVRLSDTKPMQLNKNLAADGRWHLLTFCSGDFARKGLHEVAREFGNLIKMFTPAGDPVDKVFSHTLLIKAERKTIEIDQLPEVFFPHTGPYNLRNVHRVFVDDTNPYMLGCGQAFSKYGINAEQGAIVVVRPDLYTARVLSLSQVADLFTFFKGCLSSIG
ncbi:hypothetical protein HZS61_010820 [Fusarium oxysporum f. sp. conglutinans]|uniref:Phenol 2-monooxygenase n=1 Tax=Fusarium oxysporum f. sp. conglutinans TaxID=100902 RepID=A0A8H6GWY9_FUSOX|nr:hypothetical protein HZS61_010820 [Fusarium oxysporum f. sp. conglutinans]